MREILFRGKASTTKEHKWIYGNLIKTKYGYKIINDNYSKFVFDYSIGQYTGFKDESENKLFEGDIVYIDSEEEEFVIKWDEKTARFVISGDGVVYDFDNFYGYELRLIGNIHDRREQ